MGGHHKERFWEKRCQALCARVGLGKGGSDVDSAWLICVEGELVVFWQKGKKAGGVRQHADVRRMPAGR